MEYRIVEHAGEKSVVECSGRLTFSNSAAFMRVTEEIKNSGQKDWVLDLGKLEFIDSAGLGMLLMARDLIEQIGGQLWLKAATGQVAKALDLARFEELIPTEV